MEKDYLGNTLSQEQVEFFKDSRIRKDNKLLVMYHGSTSKFEKFTQPINWFTTNKRYAISHSLGNELYAAYLNCKNYLNCGNTDFPVFKEYSFTNIQLSAYSILLINKLGISEEEFNDIINFAIETNQLTEEENYNLALFSIVRTTKFANIVKSKGYDSILTIENGDTCIGVLNPEDIKSIYNKMPTNSRNINESKAITFGDLAFGKKTDTRNRMKGRGTGHFGTGFYFVGANGPYGLNGKDFYDYNPSRPIYEIDLDAYKLYRPKDNEAGYNLHKYLKVLNDSYSNDIKDSLFKHFSANRLISDMYQVGMKVVRIADRDEETFDETFNKLYAQEMVKFIKDHKLEDVVTNYEYNIIEEYVNSFYGKFGLLESDLETIFNTQEERIKSVENAITNLSRMFNISRERILEIIDKAYKTNSEDSISTLFLKSLGYEGVDVTHLNKNAQGLQGLDNFGYGTVIYDLKPGTFRKIREPREVKENLNGKILNNFKTDRVDTQDFLEELSSQQENYFKDSKIRDKDGNLLVCYHGTPNPGFKEFNSVNSKSQFGKYKFKTNNVNFFTTNKNSAKGYTYIGVEEKENIYACYLNIVNPYIVSNTIKAEIKSWQNIQDNNIRKREIQLFDKLFKKWSKVNLTNSYLDELNHDFYPLGIEFRVSNGYEESEDIVDVCKVQQNNLSSIDSKMSSYDLIDLFDIDAYGKYFKEFVIGEESTEGDYYYTTDDIVRWVLYLNEYEHANYDGIIIPDIFDSGPRGSLFDGKTTDIVTLKSSNQIKLISNLAPTSSSRIDESKLEK